MSSSNSNSNKKCTVWWDYENCPTPRGVSPAALYSGLRTALSSLRLNISDVKIYGGTGTISEQIRVDYQAMGAHCINTAIGNKKETADMRMAVDISFFALDNVGPPDEQPVIVLITGDSDFASLCSQLMNHNFQVVLACHKAIPENLRVHASSCLYFHDILRSSGVTTTTTAISGLGHDEPSSGSDSDDAMSPDTRSVFSRHRIFAAPSLFPWSNRAAAPYGPPRAYVTRTVANAQESVSISFDDANTESISATAASASASASASEPLLAVNFMTNEEPALFQHQDQQSAEEDDNDDGIVSAISMRDDHEQVLVDELLCIVRWLEETHGEPPLRSLVGIEFKKRNPLITKGSLKPIVNNAVNAGLLVEAGGTSPTTATLQVNKNSAPVDHLVDLVCRMQRSNGGQPPLRSLVGLGYAAEHPNVPTKGLLRPLVQAAVERGDLEESGKGGTAILSTTAALRLRLGL